MQQLSPNTLLQGGKYRIEKVLGQGSFGITYLAVHTTLNRKVAIKEFFMKELNSRGDDDRTITGMVDGNLSYVYAQKFRKESKNLATLDHQNIVRVTDCFDENGTFYYVMDYIEGENLNDYLKNHQMSQDEAISVILDVANALQYMHEEKDMLHLDLKPGNIMRRASDGHIFLIDFGLSKHYSSDGTAETSTTVGLGTPGYAPIEQSEHTAKGDLQPTIDIFSLGATLYKLLTQETPPTTSEMLSNNALLVDKLKSHGISDELIQLVCKSMELVANNRMQKVCGFIDMLSGINGSRKEDLTEDELLKKYHNFKTRKRWKIPFFPGLIAFITSISAILFFIIFTLTCIDGLTVTCTYINSYKDVNEYGKEIITYSACYEGSTNFIQYSTWETTSKKKAIVEAKDGFMREMKDNFLISISFELICIFLFYLIFTLCFPHKKHGHISDFADTIERYKVYWNTNRYKIYIKDGKCGLVNVGKFKKVTEPIFNMIEWKEKNTIYYGTINGRTKLYSVEVGELK